MSYTIHKANILDWARDYTGPKFHALLCDPPYHMTEMTKRFGGANSAPPKFGTDGAFTRQARGFMNARWDGVGPNGVGVAFDPETWAALAEHLYPGAFGMAFASSRGWHRMAVAIEDAGLIIHPSMFGWSYGCLSEDTEILTSDGWERFHRAIANKSVMCYNPDTDALEWHRVQETVAYDYDETAYRIHSKNTDQLVSRNHRCIVRRGGRWAFRYAETLQTAEIVPVLQAMPRLRRTVSGRKQRRVPQKNVLFAQMRRESLRRQAARPDLETAQPARAATAGGAQGRGHCLSGLRRIEVAPSCMAPQGENGVLFGAMPIETRTRRATAAVCGEQQGNQEPQKGKSGREESRMEGRSNVFQETRQLYRREVRPLSARADQHGPERRVRYGASDYGRTSDRPAAVAGRGRTPQGSQPGEQRARQSPAVRVQSRSQVIRASRRPRADLATVTPVHYRGMVWCVRVPTGAFVARRNGKVFITGNSGFPKATRIDVQLDRRAGAERQVVGTRKHAPKFDAAGHGYREKDNGYNSKDRETFDVTAPATELAADWTGHRYGLQAIKPALEPIIVFQKPYAGRPVDCIAETGAGALWIDGGRIGTEDDTKRTPAANVGWTPARFGYSKEGMGGGGHAGGRWPANLILQHSPRCDAGGCAEDCAVRALGAQSGESVSQVRKPGGAKFGGSTYASDDYTLAMPATGGGVSDTGTAARYFYASDWTLDRLEDADPVYYAAKASRSEREAGLDPRTIAMMRLIDDSDEEEEIGEVDDPNRVYNQGRGFKGRSFRDGAWVNVDDFPETTVDDGRQKSIDNAYQRGETKRRNPHPTVKPLSLCRYLATLLLPPARYGPRRLLVPFAGVASEVVGGMLAGWEEVQGVELDEEDIHIPVANARIRYWLQRRAELSDPSKPITVRAPRKMPAGQLDMFAAEESKVEVISYLTHEEWLAKHEGRAAEPFISFEDWIARTGNHGGTREEWERIYQPEKYPPLDVGGVYADQKWANSTIRRCPEHDAPIPSGKNAYKCGCSIKHAARDAA